MSTKNFQTSDIKNITRILKIWWCDIRILINTSWCKCEVAEQESLSGLHQSSTSGKNCAQWFDRIFNFNIIIDHGRSGEEEIETGQSPCLWVFVKRTPCPLIIVSLKPIVTPILRALNTSQAVTLDNSDFYEFTRLSAIINQFTNGNQVWLGCQWWYLGRARTSDLQSLKATH